MQAEILEWIDDIEIEDLPEYFRSLAQVIGVKNVILLAAEAGGTTLYIPKAESVLQMARDRRIKNEFDGSNAKELARKYNLSESWVRQIIRQENPNQATLFDDEDGL